MPHADPKSGKKWVGVCMTPALVGQYPIKGNIVVVIDVLRATTSMCVAFDHGVKSIVPVLNIEDAQPYKDKGYLSAGERGGEQVEGFDFGNSPYSFMDKKLKGKNLVMTTTNGTKALHESLKYDPKEVLIGSFANITVLCEYLTQKKENVLLLCAGYQDMVNLEDTIFAGAVVRRLRGTFELYEDGALVAETMFRIANRRKRYFLRNSSHYNRVVEKLKIQSDVKYALRRDTHPVVPRLEGEKLVRVK